MAKLDGLFVPPERISARCAGKRISYVPIKTIKEVSMDTPTPPSKENTDNPSHITMSRKRNVDAAIGAVEESQTKHRRVASAEESSPTAGRVRREEEPDVASPQLDRLDSGRQSQEASSTSVQKDAAVEESQIVNGPQPRRSTRKSTATGKIEKAKASSTKPKPMAATGRKGGRAKPKATTALETETAMSSDSEVELERIRLRSRSGERQSSSSRDLSPVPSYIEDEDLPEPSAVDEAYIVSHSRTPRQDQRRRSLRLKKEVKATARDEVKEGDGSLEVDSGTPAGKPKPRQQRKKHKISDADVSPEDVIELPSSQNAGSVDLGPNPSLVKLKISPAKLADWASKVATRRSVTPESESGDASEEMSSMLDVVTIDPDLLQLSQDMCQRHALDMKPQPQGQPLVWADSRQALCETVPYFKMPQSGCHQNDRHVYAFLFDSVGHCREYMDTDVIIARAGGGMEVDGNGQLQQKKDHSMSESQVLSVLNDIEHQNPLVIICGNKNQAALCQMPHRYNVLGWFKPVAVWAERTLGKGKKAWTTVKYRFERLDSISPAWHSPVDADHRLTEEQRQLAGPLVRQTCKRCAKEFPLVYLEGWMCLNADCARFWRSASGKMASYGTLAYNPAFLLDRMPWKLEQEPYSVKPPVVEVGKLVGDNLTYINTRGICCPQCGRCNSRRFFKGWRCDNPECDFENFPKHIPVKAQMLHNPWETVGDGPTLARNKHEKAQGARVEVSYKSGFKVFTYTFEGIEGRFVHAVSNAKINRRSRGADEMFAAMQMQDDPDMDLHLERRRFGHAKPEGNKEGKVDKGGLKVNVKEAATSTLLPLRFEDVATQAWQNLQQADHVRSRDTEAVRQHAASKLLGRSTVSDNDTAMDVDMDDAIPHTAGDDPRPLPGSAEAGERAATSGPRQTIVEDGEFMTAFSMNYGMPYKFVASGASLPFTGSPWPVRACRADLNWASKMFLDEGGDNELNEGGENDVNQGRRHEFNELLIFAYLEGQKIEYHDDGESGLGPRIATMSLGGKAKMHMRLKTKHYVGCSKTGILTADRPVPGGLGGPAMDARRLAAWEELQELKGHDRGREYEARRKALPAELGLLDKRTKKADDLVTVTLNHGDVVIMDGYEIQRYLEHKVVPESCLRFALTCRTVLPDHLTAAERPWYEVEADDPAMGSLYRMGMEDVVGDGRMDG